MKCEDQGDWKSVSHWNLCDLVTWDKPLPLPGPQFSLQCYGVLDRKILRHSLDTLTAVSNPRCLDQGSVGVSVPRLGAENGEEVENPPPGSLHPTHLHARVEGSVHLGLDIHHLSDTGERKAGGEPSRGDREGEEGPQILAGPPRKGAGRETLWLTESHRQCHRVLRASWQGSVRTSLSRWGSGG